ncbi:DUF4352 domain-containing protein [Staphylococcus haemolyticus]|uniref:DUF4352 domain-containing protein n=1 Tax=Staphylococcus haemolyticus TaxID=1283 RepID=UPI000A69B26E|nr:DUF4352 domain-containing protein [Staphylococcus haemolyticus]MCH4381958.1 DUF4352 domain-containing protein [Staphylococcus haemolyticus]MCH4388409.1 DUF4352 domain-containing protein [Staphylococcus haemolyticus]MCH4403182.1 DUF4352 domain-containing protein [Staphylococcus haemolyticus]MCH4518224.1 DUF4352 domain-containing protein [Staphylococcus haemolyticus]MCH4534681.1 DUF4352 domain-containing protein [Staphylococcus haemolyticus]
MKRLFFISIIFLVFLGGCSFSDNKDKAEGEETNNKAKATDKMKKFKIGQVVDADGVDIKVVKAEFVDNHDEYSAPVNGKALRVYIKFRNNNDDQVLMDNTDFSMKVNNENYEEWYGSEDMHEGFSHQLNQHNTASGYITYNVPDSDQYTLELDTVPNFNKVRGQWIINKSEIKNSNVTKDTSTSSTTDVEDESDTTSSSKKENDDSDEADVGVTYPAYMYNALVDEYNSLTDGEKMNHVSKDVLEIEYNQLEARVEALYEKENAKAKKNTKKQCKIMKTNWLKKNMNNNKQNKLKMKHLNLMTIQMVLVLMIHH